MRHHFADSPGGLPGNDDSGALGSPTVERAELTTGDRSLTISTAAGGPATVYLDAVRLNGESLDRTWLTYDDEVLRGGRLELGLGSDPTRYRSLSLPSDLGQLRGLFRTP